MTVTVDGTATTVTLDSDLDTGDRLPKAIDQIAEGLKTAFPNLIASIAYTFSGSGASRTVDACGRARHRRAALGRVGGCREPSC